MADSLFTKIIKREIPATIRLEDDEFIAFDDIHPQAPVHVLVVPKIQYETLEKVSIDDLDFQAHFLAFGRQVACQMGIGDNYRIMMNVGKDVQAVPHLHMHITGGWKNPSTLVK
jgi:histidine triad (HIT) family protein